MHSIPDLTAVIPARPDDSKTVFSQITQKNTNSVQKILIWEYFCTEFLKISLPAKIIHCFLFETTVFVFISLFFVVYVQSSVYLSSPMKNNASVPGPE